MFKIIVIVLSILCAATGLDGVGYSSLEVKPSKDEIGSRYVEQIECEHRCNNFAERSLTISIPTTNITSSAVRSQYVRASEAVSTLHSISTGCHYCIRFSLYRSAGKRVIDYYLDTLCHLRL